MLLHQAADGFDLNDQESLDHKIRVIIAEQGSVPIPDLQRALLLHGETLPAQSGRQTVFVYFLQMPVSKIPVHGECGLADRIA